MTQWLEHLVPLAGIALSLTVAWMLIRSLVRHGHPETRLHLTAFCTHCGWEGRVSRSRMVCVRCGSQRLSVVAT